MRTEFITATDKDIDLMLQMMVEFNALFNYPMNLEKRKDVLSQFFSDEKFGRIWIIQSNSEVAGYAVLTFGFSFERNGRDAFIDELYLKPAHRNKGIGRLA